MVVFMVAVLAILTAILYFTIKPLNPPTPSPTATPEVTATPETSSTPAPGEHEGWNKYRSEEYDFEIFYPNDYEALDDANNLYGWPNAVVLLYTQ